MISNPGCLSAEKKDTAADGSDRETLNGGDIAAAEKAVLPGHGSVSLRPEGQGFGDGRGHSLIRINPKHLILRNTIVTEMLKIDAELAVLGQNVRGETYLQRVFMIRVIRRSQALLQGKAKTEIALCDGSVLIRGEARIILIIKIT